MKKKIIALVAAIALSGCAARDEYGNIEYNDDGSEKISIIRTTALVVGIPLLILGAAAVANNGGGGNYSAPPPQDPCECPNDIASDDSFCGERSAYWRFGGKEPTRAYCMHKEFINKQEIRYRY